MLFSTTRLSVFYPTKGNGPDLNRLPILKDTQESQQQLRGWLEAVSCSLVSIKGCCHFKRCCQHSAISRSWPSECLTMAEDMVEGAALEGMIFKSGGDTICEMTLPFHSVGYVMDMFGFTLHMGLHREPLASLGLFVQSICLNNLYWFHRYSLSRCWILCM